MLFCVIRDVFDDLADGAVQDLAKQVQRLRADRLAVFHTVQRIGRNALFEDQMVFRDLLFQECLIEWTVCDHVFITVTIILYLTS